MVDQLSGQIWRESYAQKLNGTIELTICLTNWMTNLVNKFIGKICWNNQVHKLGVQFGETIGLKNMVEKWVENLAEKIGGIIGLRNLFGKA